MPVESDHHCIVNKASVFASILFVLLGTFFIVRADLANNQTFDEAAHIACGMQYLTHGTFNYETLHPPLARTATAVLPFAFGIRNPDLAAMYPDGNAVLNWHGQYTRNLLLARLGILPFFWLTCYGVYRFTKKHFCPAQASIAVSLIALCPLVLAHSALATTDAALMALFFCATVAFANYLDDPSRRHLVWASIALGLSVLSKFTAIPFFAVTASLLIAYHAFKQRKILMPLRHLFLVTVCALPVIWAGYHFEVAPIYTSATTGSVAQKQLDAMSPHKRAVLEKLPIPAPRFFRGLLNVFTNVSGTRTGFLLGRSYSGGRWDFFPVGILVKSTLPMLLLFFIGLFVVLRRHPKAASEDLPGRYPTTTVLVSGIAGPLLIGMVGNMNIGVRHVLPVFPFIAVLASIGAAALYNTSVRYRSLGYATVTALLIANAISCFAASPDLIPYFNAVAAPFDGRILLDSDRDWGEDFYKLEAKLAAVPPADVSVAYFGDADIYRHDSAQWHTLQPGQRVTGWVAVSETLYGSYRDQYNWLNKYPFVWVGRSIRLYHIPGDIATEQ